MTETYYSDKEYYETARLHKRIQSLFAYGGTVAARATLACCDPKQERNKTLYAWIQRNRGFFSYFSKKQSELYLSYIYVFVIGEIASQAVVNCEIKAKKELVELLGLFYSNGNKEQLKPYWNIFNICLRFELLNNLKFGEKVTDRFILTLFSVLSQLPPAGYVDSYLEKIIVLTCNGKPEDPSEQYRRALFSYAAIKDYANEWQTEIFTAPESRLDAYYQEYVQKIEAGEFKPLDMWFRFNPPLENLK